MTHIKRPMSMKKIINLIVLVLIAGSAIASEKPTGVSYADDILKKDVRREIKSLEKSCILLGHKGIPAIGQPKIINYQPISEPRTPADPWEEMWTIQRKDYTVQYKIAFTPTPEKGGCDIKVTSLFKVEDLQDQEKIKRQTAFFSELKDYSLPARSIESGFPPSNPSFNLYLAAERIAREQGLISDATMSSVGKLVVGKKQNDDSIIIGIQFLQFDGGGVGLEYIKKWDVLNMETGQALEKEYVSALTKEFYENFNK